MENTEKALFVERDIDKSHQSLNDAEKKELLALGIEQFIVDNAQKDTYDGIKIAQRNTPAETRQQTAYYVMKTKALIVRDYIKSHLLEKRCEELRAEIKNDLGEMEIETPAFADKYITNYEEKWDRAWRQKDNETLFKIAYALGAIGMNSKRTELLLAKYEEVKTEMTYRPPLSVLTRTEQQELLTHGFAQNFVDNMYKISYDHMKKVWNSASLTDQQNAMQEEIRTAKMRIAREYVTDMIPEEIREEINKKQGALSRDNGFVPPRDYEAQWETASKNGDYETLYGIAYLLEDANYHDELNALYAKEYDVIQERQAQQNKEAERLYEKVDAKQSIETFAGLRFNYPQYRKQINATEEYIRLNGYGYKMSLGFGIGFLANEEIIFNGKEGAVIVPNTRLVRHRVLGGTAQKEILTTKGEGYTMWKFSIDNPAGIEPFNDKRYTTTQDGGILCKCFIEAQHIASEILPLKEIVKPLSFDNMETNSQDLNSYEQYEISQLLPRNDPNNEYIAKHTTRAEYNRLMEERDRHDLPPEVVDIITNEIRDVIKERIERERDRLTNMSKSMTIDHEGENNESREPRAVSGSEGEDHSQGERGRDNTGDVQERQGGANPQVGRDRGLGHGGDGYRDNLSGRIAPSNDTVSSGRVSMPRDDDREESTGIHTGDMPQGGLEGQLRASISGAQQPLDGHGLNFNDSVATTQGTNALQKIAYTSFRAKHPEWTKQLDDAVEHIRSLGCQMPAEVIVKGDAGVIIAEVEGTTENAKEYKIWGFSPNTPEWTLPIGKDNSPWVGFTSNKNDVASIAGAEELAKLVLTSTLNEREREVAKENHADTVYTSWGTLQDYLRKTYQPQINPNDLIYEDDIVHHISRWASLNDSFPQKYRETPLTKIPPKDIIAAAKATIEHERTTIPDDGEQTSYRGYTANELEELLEMVDNFARDNGIIDQKQILEHGENKNSMSKTTALQSTDSPDTPRTRNQIASIREQCREILKKDDSDITNDDKAILSQYEGGGGIKQEKDRSVDAVLNEFYTPRNVINKVWELVDYYVPDAQTVLEPSSGIGRFAEGRMQNKVTLREIDATSARIARLLHPAAEVIQGPFQAQFFDENGIARKKDFVLPKYDVVIGNPPYGSYTNEWKGKGEGAEHTRQEEYFIDRGVDSLNDNGVMAFVVPSGFLRNANNAKLKERLGERAELIDAWRLPNGTFGTTDVGTDIIVLRRHFNAMDKAKDYAARMMNDAFFKENNRHILGEVKTRTGRFGEETYIALPDGKTIDDMLSHITPGDYENSILLHTENAVLKQHNETEERPVEKELSNIEKAAAWKPVVNTLIGNENDRIRLGKYLFRRRTDTKEIKFNCNELLAYSKEEYNNIRKGYNLYICLDADSGDSILMYKTTLIAHADRYGNVTDDWKGSETVYKNRIDRMNEIMDEYKATAALLAHSYIGCEYIPIGDNTTVARLWLRDTSINGNTTIMRGMQIIDKANERCYDIDVGQRIVRAAIGIEVDTGYEASLLVAQKRINEDIYNFLNPKYDTGKNVFYATPDVLYPKEGKPNFEAVRECDKRIRERWQDKVKEFKLPYEELDYDDASWAEKRKQQNEAENRRARIPLEELLNASGMTLEEYETAARDAVEKNIASLKKIRSLNKEMLKKETENKPFFDALSNAPSWKAGANIQTNLGSVTIMDEPKDPGTYTFYLNGSKIIFVNEGRGELKTYNNFPITRQFYNKIQEICGGGNVDLKIGDEKWKYHTTSLEYKLANKTIDTQKTQTGKMLARSVLSPDGYERKNNLDLPQKVITVNGTKITAVQDGTYIRATLDGDNYCAFEMDGRTRELFIYQAAFDSGIWQGIEDGVKEAWGKADVTKEVTLGGVNYSDRNGETVTMNQSYKPYRPKMQISHHILQHIVR